MKRLLHAFVLSGVLLMTTAHGVEKTNWTKTKQKIYKGIAFVAATCVAGVSLWYGFKFLKNNFWVSNNPTPEPAPTPTPVPAPQPPTPAPVLKVPVPAPQNPAPVSSQTQQEIRDKGMEFQEERAQRLAQRFQELGIEEEDDSPDLRAAINRADDLDLSSGLNAGYRKGIMNVVERQKKARAQKAAAQPAVSGEPVELIIPQPQFPLNTEENNGSAQKMPADHSIPNVLLPINPAGDINYIYNYLSMSARHAQNDQGHSFANDFAQVRHRLSEDDIRTIEQDLANHAFDQIEVFCLLNT